MGIQGLLRFLKDAATEIHIREYAGRSVAIDTYCWLHRGAFACADKLAKGEKTDQYIKYCMKFVDMLESYNVRPILVFDGCHLPSKMEVEKQRRERRELYMQKGKQFLREGRLNEARDAFTKCISVTPQMALAVMEVARERGVDCIVAPYEADAQLAYLLKQGYAQAVVTEDSDLLCFGCQTVILKLDLTGRAQELSLDRLEMVKSLSGFTLDSFRHMCILSGCDYLPSIKGIGLAKACKALKLSKNKDINQTVRKLHQYVKGIAPVEPEYALGFERANNTFLYQLVFDPKTRTLMPLHPYPVGITHADVDYAGPLIKDKQALQIAWGNTNINNGETFGNFDADEWLNSRHWNGKNKMKRCSIWQKDKLALAMEHLDEGEPSTGRKATTSKSKQARVIDSIFGGTHSRRKSLHTKSTVKQAEYKTESNDNALLQAYQNSGQPAARGGQTLRQRMRSKSNLNVSAAPVVIRSRFFNSKACGDSFAEDSTGDDLKSGDNSEVPDLNVSSTSCSNGTVQQTEVEETPLSTILADRGGVTVNEGNDSSSPVSTQKPEIEETPECVTASNDPVSDGGQFLETILAELATGLKNDPHVTKLSPTRRRKTPRKSSPRNPLSLKSSRCAVMHGGKKRKIHYASESYDNAIADEEKRSDRLSIYKRTVHRQAQAYDDDSKPHDPPGDQQPHNPEGCRTIHDATYSSTLSISTETIPHLDDQELRVKQSPDPIDHSPKIAEPGIDTESVVPKPYRGIVSAASPDINEKCFPLADTCNRFEAPGPGNSKHTEPACFNGGQETRDPIVLSSDEENIPLIDNISERACKRQKTIGLTKKTSPPMSSSTKSKYFGEAKASGLRRKKVLTRAKMKVTAAKNQPTISSLFKKAVS